MQFVILESHVTPFRKKHIKVLQCDSDTEKPAEETF